ncbi:MAG TPA: DUF2809 domain-containing protein [Verrucomicrobiae bacterium]|nr:DUF2809 domain-containing protein [Verrucomicrobiae bacterium]
MNRTQVCRLPAQTISLNFGEVEKTFPNGRVRRRTWSFVALVSVILLGLASRRYPIFFPSALGKYPGDALWALMVFIVWGIVFPRKPVLQILVFTLATSYCVEVCKLYRTEWLNDFRNSTMGHLLLGSTFSWQNLITYTIGAVIGALAERVLLSFQAKSDIRS